MVNGCLWGVHLDGGLFPISGESLIQLGREAYKALGILNDLGASPQTLVLIRQNRIIESEIESALNAYRGMQ